MSDLLVSLLVVAACVLGACARREDNATPACVVPGDCASGFTCYRGYCIPSGVGIDAAIAGDAGDVGPDAAVMTCEGAGVPCTYPMPGVCSDGRTVCTRAGTTICGRAVEPSAESCNMRDDDCDGVVDENADVPCYGGTEGCNEDLECVGVCVAGLQRCVNGVLGGACEGERLPAAVDGCTAVGVVATDDDCDGDIDEDCTCTGTMTAPCYPGPRQTADVGACEAGTMTCSGGSFGECVGATMPATETCPANMRDDDCNGTVDDVSGTGGPCMAEGMGVCADGHLACAATGGDIVCMGTPSSDELCDGLDNDCDGAVDETFDLMNDADNCSACGLSCGEGRACCGGECVSLDVDAAHCGMCDRACEGTTSACCGGTCRDPAAAECNGCSAGCGMGETCCTRDRVCVDNMNDVAHCGAGADGCGVACAAGALCCDGMCVSPGTDAHCAGCGACGTDQQCCGARCGADLDRANCGGCGRGCRPGEECCDRGGVIACANTSDSEDHCGRCGNACASGQTCSSGLCCPTGQINCGGTCINPLTNASNCGSCGNGCVLGCCSGGCCLI